MEKHFLVCSFLQTKRWCIHLLIKRHSMFFPVNASCLNYAFKALWSKSTYPLQHTELYSNPRYSYKNKIYHGPYLSGMYIITNPLPTIYASMTFILKRRKLRLRATTAKFIMAQHVDPHKAFPAIMLLSPHSKGCHAWFVTKLPWISSRSERSGAQRNLQVEKSLFLVLEE